MAAKLTLAAGYKTDFTNGQGVGRPAYKTYYADFDTNFNLIATSVNSLVDEVNSARLVDSQLTYDSLLRPIHLANGSVGRMSPWEARGTFTTTQTTVTSGRIYAGGRRINVIGATLTQTGTAAQTNYIAVDVDGSLSISTSPGAKFFDLIIMTRSGGINTAMTENLDFNQNEPLASAAVANRIFEKRRGATLGGGLHPPMRLVSILGVEEDAGFSYFGVNHMRWQSERDGGPATGNSVNAADFTAFGQLQLNQQSRIYAIRSTSFNIATGGGTAITWDTPVANSAGLRTWRREPSEYFANPWLAASGATLTLPADTDCEGTYLMTASATFTPVAATGFMEMRIVVTNGTPQTVAIIRIPTTNAQYSVSCSGMCDLQVGATIQVICQHGEAGNVPVSAARVGIMMIGGPVN